MKSKVIDKNKEITNQFLKFIKNWNDKVQYYIINGYDERGICITQETLFKDKEA